MFEYVVPGGELAGYCLATDRLLVALDAALQPIVAPLWSRIRGSGAGLDEAFGVLAGRGVSAAPAFAIAELLPGGTVRARAHGEAIAQVLGEPAVRIDGGGLSTWREATWEGITGVMVGLKGARQGVETLPIVTGVVRADWIRCRALGAAARPAIRLGPRVLGLERPIVIGRGPRTTTTASGHVSVPIVVESPGRAVSATHLLVERQGALARLEDLGSRNGSLVELPDGTRRLLRDRAEILAPIGARIEIGDGIRLEVVEAGGPAGQAP